MIALLHISADSTDFFWQLDFHNTIECRYIATRYNMIFDTLLLWRMQNINQDLNPQMIPHISTYRASYGVTFMRSLEEIDNVIKARRR